MQCPAYLDVKTSTQICPYIFFSNRFVTACGEMRLQRSLSVCQDDKYNCTRAVCHSTAAPAKTFLPKHWCCGVFVSEFGVNLSHRFSSKKGGGEQEG